MTGLNVIAHVSGLPIEEVVSLALAAGATASLGARVAWQRMVSRRRGAQSPR